MQLPTCRFYYIIIFFTKYSHTGLSPLLYPVEMGKNRIHSSHTRRPSLLYHFHNPWQMDTLGWTPWGHTRNQGRPRTRCRDGLDSLAKTLVLCSTKRGPLRSMGKAYVQRGDIQWLKPTDWMTNGSLTSPSQESDQRQGLKAMYSILIPKDWNKCKTICRCGTMAAHSTQLFEDPECWAAQKLKPGLPPQRLIL